MGQGQKTDQGGAYVGIDTFIQMFMEEGSILPHDHYVYGLSIWFLERQLRLTFSLSLFLTD